LAPGTGLDEAVKGKKQRKKTTNGKKIVNGRQNENQKMNVG